ncbi:MAG: ROK family protein, partial [Phycisphaeraceae bacterium]
MAKANLYFGIDLGGTNIQAAIYDADKQEIVVRDGTKTKAAEGADAVLGRIEKLCRKLLDKASLTESDLSGLGIGAPGAIDFDHGLVLDAQRDEPGAMDAFARAHKIRWSLPDAQGIDAEAPVRRL